MSEDKLSDSEEKIFMKVIGVKIDDIQNWHRPSTLSDQLSPETEGRKNGTPVSFVAKPAVSTTSSRFVTKPTMSSEGLVGCRTQKGFLVSVNDELIALFKVDSRLYAVRDSCPHAGGPLSMGDIEELPGEGLCVRCPWHHWAVLLESGAIGEHKGRSQSAQVFPVKVTSQGDIYIGFSQVSKSFFNTDNF